MHSVVPLLIMRQILVHHTLDSPIVDLQTLGVQEKICQFEVPVDRLLTDLEWRIFGSMIDAFTRFLIEQMEFRFFHL